MDNVSKLATEQVNEKSARLDQMTSLEIVTLMNQEDQLVSLAVKKALPSIAEAADTIADRLSRGGRLIYVGAGTSGRLGVLDASECPPTFSTHPDLVLAMLAGGNSAMFQAAEGAEDNQAAGEQDLLQAGLSEKDAVVGISASGRTPYVIGALTYARQNGAATISLSCNSPALASQYADVAIEVVTGPEVLSGSTRLKAGTATKLVLNMLSTSVMVKLGKVYRNLMIDVQPTNEKLVDRSCRILMKAAGVSFEGASAALQSAGNKVKVALVILKTGLSSSEAEAKLHEANGFVRAVIGE